MFFRLDIIATQLRVQLKRFPLWIIVTSLWATPAWALDVGQADRLVNQWLETERQADTLNTEWQQQQPVLDQRIALLKAEKQQLQQVLSRNQNGHSEIEQKRAELLSEQTTIEQQQIELQRQLTQLETQLNALAPLLPPPLKTQWQREAQALGQDPTTSTRLQVALAQLSALSDFNGRITVDERSVTSPEGKPLMVKQFYLGLAQAWFSSADGHIAGMGRATLDGWEWHVDEQLDGRDVLKAIAIYERRKVADFVRLPLTLDVGAQ